MTPQPDEPKAVVLVNPDGTVRVAANLRGLDVKVVNSKNEFETESLGLSFNH